MYSTILNRERFVSVNLTLDIKDKPFNLVKLDLVRMQRSKQKVKRQRKTKRDEERQREDKWERRSEYEFNVIITKYKKIDRCKQRRRLWNLNQQR